MLRCPCSGMVARRCARITTARRRARRRAVEPSGIGADTTDAGRRGHAGAVRSGAAVEGRAQPLSPLDTPGGI